MRLSLVGQSLFHISHFKYCGTYISQFYVILGNLTDIGVSCIVFVAIIIV